MVKTISSVNGRSVSNYPERFIVLQLWESKAVLCFQVTATYICIKMNFFDQFALISEIALHKSAPV